MKRGQVALEFLITYGWALLALLAVIGVMGYFTGFYTKMIPSTCTLSPPFSCLEYKVQDDGTVFLGIQNMVSDVIYVNLTLFCNQDPVQGRSFEQATLLLPQAHLNDSLVAFSCPVTGSQFKGNIEILYRNSGESALHLSRGELRTRIES